MLTRENYTEQHIYDLWKETGADPSILERTVFAYFSQNWICRFNWLKFCSFMSTKPVFQTIVRRPHVCIKYDKSTLLQ